MAVPARSGVRAMTIGVPSSATDRRTAVRWSSMTTVELRSLAAPMALLLLALAIRLVVAPFIVFPVTEDGMYYEHVAARLVSGDGLTSLAMWSYSTPPLVLPRPAFEIWMPGTTLAWVPFMALLGPTHEAAQVGSIVLGSLVAPIAWWLGRDATRSLGLDRERVAAIAIGCGVLAAVLGPFVVAAADPDSTTVFLITGALAALLMQRMLAAPTVARGVALGIALALAYLTRQEAIWLGMTYLIMVMSGAHRWTGRWPAELARRLVPVVVGGLLLVVPWLLRQWLAFGTPFPGQALENALHIRGDDIFAYLDRPSIERFLAQGMDTLIAQRITALTYQAQGLLVVAFPVGLLGAIGAVALARTRALRPDGALFALVMSGLLIFLTSALLFPIATLWGTFRHSAGPLLLGFVVLAILVGDLVVRRLAAALHRPEPRAWVASMLIIGASIPASLGWLALNADKARDMRADMAAISETLRADSGPVDVPTSGAAPTAAAEVMSSLPIMTAASSGLRTIALPDEAPEVVAQLAGRFGVSTLVVIGSRSRYPDALLVSPRHPCLVADPVRIGLADDPAWLFRLDPACAP